MEALQPKQVIRIIVTGAIGSGKTTFVNALTEIGQVSSPVIIGDYQTPYQIDIGRKTISPTNTEIYLLAGYVSTLIFRPPAAEDEAEATELQGYMVLVDSRRNPSFMGYTVPVTKEIITTLHQRGKPYIIAATKADADEVYTSQEICTALDLKISQMPIYHCSAATDHTSCKRVLAALLSKFPPTERIEQTINYIQQAHIPADDL